MPDDVSIIRQYEVQRLTQGGQAQSMMRVEFKVGEDGPFSVEIPREQYSAESARFEINIIAEEVRALRA